MSVIAPERSLQQRMDALERANEIRSRRAQFKRDLKAERKRVHDFIEQPPSWLETMKVNDVLLALPRVGRVKTNQILRNCRMSPSKTVGGLSPRQRGELLSMLRR